MFFVDGQQPEPNRIKLTVRTPADVAVAEFDFCSNSCLAEYAMKRMDADKKEKRPWAPA
jgi:hypothetical protein